MLVFLPVTHGQACVRRRACENSLLEVIDCTGSSVGHGSSSPNVSKYLNEDRCAVAYLNMMIM